MSWIEVLAGVICLAIGGFFGYFAIAMLRKNYKTLTKGISMTGVITGHQRVGYQSMSEEIEFQTLNGEKVSFVSPFSTYGATGRCRDIGTKIKVLYNPKNTQDVVDASFFKFWFFPFCILVAALGAVYLSFCLFFGITPP